MVHGQGQEFFKKQGNGSQYSVKKSLPERYMNQRCSGTEVDETPFVQQQVNLAKHKFILYAY